MYNIKNGILKIKKGMMYSFAFGFGVGLIPNHVFLDINNKRYSRLPPVPLLTGCIGLIGFVCSPLLLINYFAEGVYLDKFIDKYEISFERYHQYNSEENKYAFPSIIFIKIKTIKQSNKILK